MRVRLAIVVALMLFFVVLARQAAAQGDAPASSSPQVDVFKPAFVPVGELLPLLGVQEREGQLELNWVEGGQTHAVRVRSNEPANQLILVGSAPDLATVQRLAHAVDLAPRQIDVEATIVEIDENKANDLGIDWEGMWRGSGTGTDFQYQKRSMDQRRDDAYYPPGQHQVIKEVDRFLAFHSRADVSSFVRLVQEQGIGRVRNTPHILTLNNRTATLLDGQRVTYVTRASAYANIYETQVMDAGLSLNVRPTIGESGYLTIKATAELTNLSGGEISGSPIKDGQILDNSIVVKDGDTVVLGGFKRVVDSKRTRRLPVLGQLIPFLFSREIHQRQTLSSYILLTARAVDFQAGPDERMRQEIEGK